MSKEYIMQLEATIENLRRDNQLLKKLNAKYKDLEEELGCPLEAVVKVDEYISKMIDYYNFRDYTVDYIFICEQASIDEAIDYFKFDKPNQEKVYELYSIKKFLEGNETEIKSKLLKYQQNKYGDIGLGNVRVQGM